MVEPLETVRPKDVPKTKQQAFLTDESVSALRKYRLLVVGDPRWSAFFRYEVLTMLLTGLGGSLGLWLRQKLYRWLFYRMGRGVAIGRYVTLRAPFRIALGNRVVVEDFVLLDGRGVPGKSREVSSLGTTSSSGGGPTSCAGAGRSMSGPV